MLAEVRSERDAIVLDPTGVAGSLEPINIDTLLFDGNKLFINSFNSSSALRTVVNELITNISDQLASDKNVSEIYVKIDSESMTIRNNGSSVEIIKYSDYKKKKKIKSKPNATLDNLYLPAVLFTIPHSGTNFKKTGKDNKYATGGNYGIGAKVVYLTSDKFEIKVRNKNGKLFQQKFSISVDKDDKVRYVDGDPIVVKDKLSDDDISEVDREYVEIKFYPSKKLFGNNPFNDKFKYYIYRRVCDVAAVYSKSGEISINFDGIKKINGFKSVKDYLKLIGPSPILSYRILGEGSSYNLWDVHFVIDPGFNGVASFINGINTQSGGTHVDLIKNQFVNLIHKIYWPKYSNIDTEKIILKRIKDIIDEGIFFFISTHVKNKQYNGYLKDKLVIALTEFIKLPDLAESEKFVKYVMESKELDTLITTKLNEFRSKNEREKLKVTAKSKDAKEYKKEFYVSAKWTSDKSKRKNTCLICAEGKSAKAAFTKVLSLIDDGKNKYGVLAFKGKPVNARNRDSEKNKKREKQKSLEQDVIYATIMDVLGLLKKSNDEETDYGTILAAGDPDADGRHIVGLMICLFTKFPKIYKKKGFFKILLLPYVRVYMGNEKTPERSRKQDDYKNFMNNAEFEEWQRNFPEEADGRKAKHYKGLGTFTDKEMAYFFKNINKFIVSIDTSTDIKKTNELLSIMFDKENSIKRKNWYNNHKDNLGAKLPIKKNGSIGVLTLEDFFSYLYIEFQHLSMTRAIPDIFGMKNVQNKILWCLLSEKNEKKQFKVSAITGIITAKSEYNHGDQSMCGSIEMLASKIIPYSNLPLLIPIGQFDKRTGDKASAPRYIHVSCSNFMRKIIRPEDNSVVKYVKSENGKDTVEPVNYYPVIPILLCRGMTGIASGIATKCPPFSVPDIIKILIENLTKKNEKFDIKTFNLKPCYRKYKGEIIKVKIGNTGKKFKYCAISKLKFYSNNNFRDDHGIKKILCKITEMSPTSTLNKGYENLENAMTKKHLIIDIEKRELVDDKIDIVAIFSVPYVYSVANGKTMPKSITDKDIDEIISKVNNSKSCQYNIQADIGIAGDIQYNMNAFKNGKIYHYDNPKKIMFDYYGIRLQKYAERRLKMIKVLEGKIKMAELELKITSSLIVKDRTEENIRSQIVEILGTKDEETALLNPLFDKFGKKKLFSQNKNNIKKLEEKIKKLKESLKDLEETNKFNMWIRELDEISSGYKNYIEEIDGNEE